MAFRLSYITRDTCHSFTKDLFSLNGRVALITGGSRGIGAMIAKGFLEHGCKRVYITARKQSQLDMMAKTLTKSEIYNGECISIVGDISSMEGIKELALHIAEKEDSLDILVNNAGAVWGANFEKFPESGWDKTIDLNLKTPFFLTQALFPQLKNASLKNGHLSKVINIASIDGISVNALETYPYAASKAGLIHMTKRMSLKLIQDNIVVNSISPGAFPSEMNKVARDFSDKISLGIPSRRVGKLEDIAGAAIYLSSNAGDYVVGANLVVDGGVSFANGVIMAG